MKTPVIVRELSKKEIKKFEKGKIKPHVTLEKGERPWTSHYFEARDDTYPNDYDKNFICKILAKERIDGSLGITIVWMYPRAGFYNKSEIPVISKDKYDEMVQQFSETVFKSKKIHHEAAFLSQITEKESLIYG